MKRSGNIKDSIMMPPPKARLKSRSDTSEELRKNLTESITNISDNSGLQDEFNKFFRENEELEIRKTDDELSISKSESSNNLFNSNPSTQLVCVCSGCNNNNVNTINQNISNNILNNNLNTNNNLQLCQSCIQSNPRHSFNFNLIHYNYNYTQFSDDEENVESLQSLEKLRRNLIEETNSSNNNYINLQNPSNLTNIQNLPIISNFTKFKNFLKFPIPKNKKEINFFVNNMLTYISEHEFDSSLLILKTKIQTRDNDYKNQGLKFDYYVDSLMKMQNELISKICMFNEVDKKVKSGKH